MFSRQTHPEGDWIAPRRDGDAPPTRLERDTFAPIGRLCSAAFASVARHRRDGFAPVTPSSGDVGAPRWWRGGQDRDGRKTRIGQGGAERSDVGQGFLRPACCRPCGGEKKRMVAQRRGGRGDVSSRRLAGIVSTAGEGRPLLRRCTTPQRGKGADVTIADLRRPEPVSGSMRDGGRQDCHQSSRKDAETSSA